MYILLKNSFIKQKKIPQIDLALHMHKTSEESAQINQAWLSYYYE